MQADEVLYVGKSINIRKRWKHHHKRAELDHLNGISIGWIYCSEDELSRTELELIHYFRPPMNNKVAVVYQIDYSREIKGFIPEGTYLFSFFILGLILITAVFMLFYKSDSEINYLKDNIMVLVLTLVSFIAGSYSAWKAAREKVFKKKASDDEQNQTAIE